MSNQEPQNIQEGNPENPEEAESVNIDVASLQETLETEISKSSRYLSNWQRSEADLANYKKRVEQERNEQNKYGGSGIILNFLPVLDDLERAIEVVSVEAVELNWIDGFKLIQRKLISMLENQGVSEIKALGEVFDPNYHEAVAQAEGEEGKVIDVTRKGYQLHDRVLRPASVIVGKGK
jgi:molecular chaperone GrpE